MTTKTAKASKASKAPKAKTSNQMQLFKKLEETKIHQANLEKALGRIRVDIMNLTFPGEHRETIENVMKIVDNAMKNV
tara:strand:- start:82 stop:315 length:234 start_codon:yes stop_codon:yes gene_type:complete